MSATATEALDRLAKTVRAQFPNDETRPGVTLSFLADDQFYASINRYFGRERITIFQAIRTTMADAIESLAVEFERGVLADRDGHGITLRGDVEGRWYEEIGRREGNALERERQRDLALAREQRHERQREAERNALTDQQISDIDPWE